MNVQLYFIYSFQSAPCGKLTKLDPIPSNSNSVRSLNSLFPKIDNLEYFPLKVLLQIFASVDDIDLLNLAVRSARFERIAKMVIKERYASKYLTIDCKKFSTKPYADFFQRFGSKIKAFEAVDNCIDEKNHWIVSLLKTTKNLEKLKLDIMATDNRLFLQKYVRSKITHLTLRCQYFSSNHGFMLSKFRNLKKLEFLDYPCISFGTLRRVIYNNPGLESLCISDENKCIPVTDDILRVYPLDKLMVLFGTTCMNQLKEFAYILLDPEHYNRQGIQIRRQPNHILDAFVDSLKYLESLALSFLAVNFFADIVELLNRFASQCKNIKHLRLYDEILETIKSFKRIESLLITMHDLVYGSID